MDEAGVARWLTDYVEAWKLLDPAAIGGPLQRGRAVPVPPVGRAGAESVRGRDAIVASWLEHQDAPGSWTADYSPWLVHDDRAVAVGVSRYLAADGSTVEQEFQNVFLLVFDDECRVAFGERHMKRPADLRLS